MYATCIFFDTLLSKLAWPKREASNCLQEPQARSTFLAAEGIELMLLIIKQKRTARTGALKALDYALVHATPACERFVDVQGLRALFPLFMGKLKVTTSPGPCRLWK